MSVLETGSLDAVLRRATHDQLLIIVQHLDRPWHRQPWPVSTIQTSLHDLTRVPAAVAGALLQAGGEASRGPGTTGATPYARVLGKVCRIMGVAPPGTASVLATETRLLRDVVSRAGSLDQARQAFVAAGQGTRLQKIAKPVLAVGLAPGVAPAVFEVAVLRQAMLWADA